MPGTASAPPFCVTVSLCQLHPSVAKPRRGRVIWLARISHSRNFALFFLLSHSLFLLFFFFRNLWQMLHIYKGRQDSITNSPVPFTQLQRSGFLATLCHLHPHAPAPLPRRQSQAAWSTAPAHITGWSRSGRSWCPGSHQLSTSDFCCGLGRSVRGSSSSWVVTSPLRCVPRMFPLSASETSLKCGELSALELSAHPTENGGGR